jgi:hypothetical protein
MRVDIARDEGQKDIKKRKTPGRGNSKYNGP